MIAVPHTKQLLINTRVVPWHISIDFEYLWNLYKPVFQQQLANLGPFTLSNRLNQIDNHSIRRPEISMKSEKSGVLQKN
ncbi:hypothetical protein GCK72_002187 [Caenorhabditis remanei]|uniref:Uncharacterized protein n=1 Tax=Caenorhabditis remanei TaxID=31234 RepID=A0A6A5HRP8_CAERE|nr:hypothetical protein GCK72_002187 [Caenorhabditis remanei]KAF1770369.1 hypothetical protein GCK72_002187 [Caenorhabditis remanei]